jgi:transcription-repair coupling factor (superfamily II helicase)
VKLLPLLERFDQAPGLLDLVERLKRDGRVEAGATVDGARPALAGYLARKLGGSLIVITGHPHRAEHLAGELAPWLDRPATLFPAFESLLYERGATDHEVLARRQAAVNQLLREPAVVVASVRAVLQRVSLPRAELGALSLKLHDTVTFDEMINTLVQGGYEPAPLVEEIGTFARRGGILDVFPVGASHPVRIELLGNEIDSLRIFDPVSQRSLDRIETTVIGPLQQFDRERMKRLAGELADLPTDNLTDDALARWMEDLEQLQAGEPNDAHFFDPYLNQDGSLLDAAEGYPPGVGPGSPPVVVLEDPDDLRAVAADLLAVANRMQEELEESGELPKGLRPGLLDLGRIERGARSARIVEFSRGGDERSVEARVFSRPPAFGGRVRDFLRSLDPVGHPPGVGIRAPTPGGYPSTVVLTSFQHARLAELLQDEALPFTVTDDLERLPEAGTITIVKGSLAEGWTAPDLGLEVFTDHEIFGWSKPRATPRRRRAPRETFFTEFTAGDYVVHIEHGIGQLIGTTKMSDPAQGEAGERDYLILQYAGTDRLYVPTDQLDRVTRYVGMGDAKPQLNKLGGQEWTRAKARAKQAAEDMADELIALYAKREAEGGHAFMPDTPWQGELESSFPFEETPDQMQTIVDVKSDMEQPRAMDRLVVADVGYGKTEVAVRAAFKAVIDGSQVAVLVPTTVLGQQHLETFRERLEAFPVRIEMLSRFRSPREQKDILRRVQDGEVDIVIGTHRLLGKDVRFKDLGLLVIDEEQRFGVRHKERLKQLRAAVDVLTLTATPIPRTLHMSLTGIRDVSIIQTPPEGRLPIRTFLQPYEERLVRQAIIRELEREGQVYFVRNRVAGIEAVAQKLRGLVPEARVLVGHGQMPEDQLEKVMMSFSHQEADVLLCSTIIESGLDIPNVNTIVIDHAESLGLAQLYQLRGRVGRGVNQAYAYLLYPRDARIGQDAMRRMEAVFEATELGAGFRIAMTDLEIRGAGNLLGAEQSGHVAAIGFDLYTNLLKDAIERQRGQAQVERPQVTVDLPFDILIPASYVPDERERLALYRRLATLASSDLLSPLEEELRDRFGPPPQAVTNLLSQVGVKFQAQNAHVSVVALRGDRLTIRGEKRILYDRVALYQRFGTDARIDENVLRIEAAALQPDWLQAIKDILTDTAALRERQAAATELAASSTG